MRLVSGLKRGLVKASCALQFSGWMRQLFSKDAILLIVALSSPTFAAGDDSCGVEAMSALPDRPVAIQRVERNENAQVRVSWALRTNPEDSDAPSAPAHLQTGAEFDVLRCLPPGRWTAVGQGEVVGRNGVLVEGQLTLSGNVPSVARGVEEEFVSKGNLYPMPMVGDLVVVRRKEIALAKTVGARVTVAANELFGSAGEDFLHTELTRSGQESLREIVTKNFGSARGRLLIEVHAQRAGSREKLRQESTLRAENIGRYLRYEFGIARDQLVAVGHGADTYVTGFRPAGEPSDFVVLRILPDRIANH